MGFLFSLVIFIAVAYGYIANIVYLITHNETVGLSIARAVGIFVAPLGVILGFI